MSRRRNPPPDGYKLNDTEPRFLVIRGMGANVISCEPQPGIMDLRKAIADVRDRMTADGWEIEGLAKYSPYFFAEKDGTRIQVSIETDPRARESAMYRR